MSYNTMNTEFQEGCKRCLCVLSCRRKPCLILTDVLETEPGKAYMERIKRGRALGSRMLHSGRESGRSEKEPLVRRDVRCRWSESRNDESKSVAPKCNQSTTSSPLHRQEVCVKHLLYLQLRACCCCCSNKCKASSCIALLSIEIVKQGDVGSGGLPGMQFNLNHILNEIKGHEFLKLFVN